MLPPVNPLPGPGSVSVLEGLGEDRTGGDDRVHLGDGLCRGRPRLAVERGFARIDWTADRGNERLLRFYAELGAQAQEEKVFFRLSADALVEVAGATGESRSFGTRAKRV